ncbi:Peroxiredoxin Asp f3 [Colletotrichum sp. SAR11_59]|uniref:Thioredoxin peroxidase n=1 Tax=Colletotrichum asianum TaxID=702518 RepID=A0A8H3ZM99_9PEZI|nr:redoxin [Colletotrichum asianum]KAI8304655.1 Peroxiredoxin Asp f3 [Colletotrichum sp. SAR11_59]
MAPIKAGEQFPEGVNFQYIPYQAETSDFKVCGIPIKYDTAKEFKDKKVIIVALPGAFTPTCSAAHLPGYIAKKDELKAKGVDQVIFLAYNDPYVMSGWGKANNVADDFIIFCTDNNAEFSTSIGWNHGERTARYAIVVDHGKIIYAEKEPDLQGQEVSAVEPVLKAI